MSLDKYKGQNIIDDFVSSNDAEFKRISFDNPQLFDASIMALDFLSKRFGKSEQMKKVVVEEIKEAKEEETSLGLLPFAIGEKYLSKNSDIVFEIVEFITDRDGEAMVKVKNVAEGGIGILDVDDIVQKIKNGKWIKVEDEIVETLPFKVRDKFTTSDKVGSTIRIYTVLEINTNKNYFEFEADGVKLNGWSLEEAKELFSKGEWKLVDELPFKVGDAFKVSKTQLIFKIRNIKDDNVFMIYEDGLTANASIRVIIDGLKSGYYVPSTTFNNYPTTSATSTTSGTSGSSGSITLTSGKTVSGDANNKQFLKKQKEIKKLQKEIEGLEALEDEFLDDDTKAYIIEKKKELEALK